MSKFKGITFPFFGLLKKPITLSYDSNRITIKKITNGANFILDDRSISGSSYLDRIYKLEDKYDKQRVIFDITARKMEELINSGCVWGIDNQAKVFDLSKKEKFKYKVTDISRIKDNLFWVNGISYPFQLPDHLVGVNLKDLKAKLVYIDGVWYLHRFDLLIKYQNTIKL